MGLELSNVVKALKTKGFEQDPARSGKDHLWYRLYVEGKKTAILTKVSRSKKKYRDLGDNLVKSMATQVSLTVPQFKDFVSCTLTGPQYLAELRRIGKNLEPHHSRNS